ncbi:MAG: hypothetical protein SFW07_07945 [Gammaproteobacteria bacterium]|nr:hypothetical protein [Gammaproteobacteria bacterium]
MEEVPAYRQLADDALRLLNEKDLNGASEKIAVLQQTDANFFHYFTARIDYKRNNIASAIAHLIKITDKHSELLPDAQALKGKAISRLVPRQISRTLELFDAANYDTAIRVITSIESTGKEFDFCHFMRAKIAQKQNNFRLAVENLVKVKNTRDENSAVTRDLYSPTQKMLTEILNEQAQRALEAIKVSDFIAANAAIVIIEASNTESVFCNYIKAEIAHKQGNIFAALDFLDKATIENSYNNESLIAFDTNIAVQNLLVGLVSGQLKEKSKYKTQFVPFEDPKSDYTPISIDSEEDCRTSNINITESLEPFVKATRYEDSGIVFHFTEKLSLESQLRVLENLKTLYICASQEISELIPLPIALFGEEIPSEEQFLLYLTREQALIKGHIAAGKGLWAQAHAYYFEAFSSGTYKQELAHLKAFYFPQADVIEISEKFNQAQCYAIIKSLFVNNVIDENRFVCWLNALRIAILFPPPKEEEHGSQDESDDDTESAQNHADSRSPDAAILESALPQLDANDEPPVSEENRKLVGKIQRQILLFDSALNTENAIETEKWMSETKFAETKKIIYGEDLKDFSKRFFESAWNISRFKPLNAVVVFFAAFAFLPALARKKYQLTHKEKRTVDQISKDDEALEERRTELREQKLKKARLSDRISSSKRNLLFEEMRSQHEDDSEVEKRRIDDARQLRFAIPGASSPSKTN